MRAFLVGLVVAMTSVAIDAQAPPPSLDAVLLQQAAARHGSTAIAYWVTDKATVVRVVNRDGRATTESLPVTREKLERLVRLTWPGAPVPEESGAAAEAVPETLRLATMRGGSPLVSTGQDSNAYRQLYDLLIAPIRAALPGRDSLLTIVPDGPLSLLSFAPLSNENGRYLLEDYRLHYLATVGTGAADPPAQTAAKRDRFLFVNNPRTPANDREVRDVVRALGLRDVKTLVGKAATETAVRAEIGAARVVHVSLAAPPGDAALALAAETGPRALDGVLDATEVAGLRVPAELVTLVLSRPIDATPAAVMLAMPRAFLAAGAHSVLTTLWDVGDEPWEAFTTRFYTEWQKGGGKSAALRIAQLSVLRDLRAGQLKVNTPGGERALPSHPLLWANAVLIGEP